MIAAKNLANSATIAASTLPIRLRRLRARREPAARACRTGSQAVGGAAGAGGGVPCSRLRAGHGGSACCGSESESSDSFMLHCAHRRSGARLTVVSRRPRHGKSRGERGVRAGRAFSRNVRSDARDGLAFDLRAGYFESRRGTEPQRARPPRCEAAPPARQGPRARPSGFLKRPGTASLFVRCRRRASATAWQHGATTRCEQQTSPGTTGFDVVGSWGWLRVEVPGGLVKHPGKQ